MQFNDHDKPLYSISESVQNEPTARHISLGIYQHIEHQKSLRQWKNIRPSSTRRRLWNAIHLTLLLGLFSLISLETAPKVIGSVSIHARNAVTELGTPTRWRF